MTLKLLPVEVDLEVRPCPLSPAVVDPPATDARRPHTRSAFLDPSSSPPLVAAHHGPDELHHPSGRRPLVRPGRRRLCQRGPVRAPDGPRELHPRRKALPDRLRREPRARDRVRDARPPHRPPDAGRHAPDHHVVALPVHRAGRRQVVRHAERARTLGGLVPGEHRADDLSSASLFAHCRAPTSALESAIDQGCLQFLSSTEVRALLRAAHAVRRASADRESPPPRPQAQHVVSSLWKGEWVQRNNDNDDIDYVEYDRKHDARASFGTKFATHFNPQRLGVPRYQNICASPRRPWPSPACACSR